MGNRYDLEGKFAIVTGGARSIGRAISELLLRSGARVAIWDLNAANVDGAHSSIVDITNAESIRRGMEEIGDAQPVDILVNSAGYLGMSTAFARHATTDWRRIVEVNLVGTLLVTQAVLPKMQRQRSGRIVNLGSLAGKEGLAGIAAYSAASGGVISFTKALSREISADGIFVNCVAPGPIDTEMIRNLGPEVVDRMIEDSPLRRLGTAEEVAHLVAWLCSDASRFNTGAVFDMSGGRARY